MKSAREREGFGIVLMAEKLRLHGSLVTDQSFIYQGSSTHEIHQIRHRSKLPSHPSFCFTPTPITQNSTHIQSDLDAISPSFQRFYLRFRDATEINRLGAATAILLCSLST